MQPYKDHLSQIWAWNAKVPHLVEKRVHDLIAETVKRHPDAHAVSAWDGELTYAELDTLSTHLARRLRAEGVCENVIVPLCFEKSVWTPVAIPGVMKAGGASVLLDLALPEQRLRSILHQVGGKIIVSSVANEKFAGRLIGLLKCVVVDRATLGNMQTDGEQVSGKSIDSSSLLYVVFTSGSTGIPKGVKITHQNMCSALHHQLWRRRPSHVDRVLDFGAYSFDMVWSTFSMTLTAGACLCIPSQTELRNDLWGSIEHYNISYTEMTPSVARTINLDKSVSLRTIVLAGELLLLADVNNLKSIPRIVNAYGPSECTPGSTYTLVDAQSDLHPNIGLPAGLCAWVIDEDGSGPVPVGSVGELWLEGPLVGAGYLNNNEKTVTSFIEDPDWLLRGYQEMHGRHGRLYRTGGLVHYHPDGSLIFVGRKDDQVKVRGQRIELGEVEHHLQQLLAENISYHEGEQNKHIQVVADVVTPIRGSPTLVVFVVLPKSEHDLTGRNSQESDQFEYLLAKNQENRELLSWLVIGLDERLAKIVPTYMVPSVYIPITHVPLTATGKTDRRSLRTAVSMLLVQELFSHNATRPLYKRTPSTIRERELQQLWSKVLNIDAGSIGVNDSFLRIGGDSILAMRLVEAARDQDWMLTVADIMQYPQLSQQAAKIQPKRHDQDFASAAPYSEISHSPSNSDIINCITKVYPNIPADAIGDVYPATDIQELYIYYAQTRPTIYCPVFFVDIPKYYDFEQVVASCNALWRSFDQIRVAFVRLQGRYWHVVLKSLEIPLTVHEINTNIPSYNEKLHREVHNSTLELGIPFTKFLITRSSEGTLRLSFRMTHAQYDGVSVSVLMKALSASLNGDLVGEISQFSQYIRHAQDTEEASIRHWKRVLSGTEPASLLTSKAIPASTLAEKVPMPVIASQRTISISKLSSD